MRVPFSPHPSNTQLGLEEPVGAAWKDSGERAQNVRKHEDQREQGIVRREERARGDGGGRGRGAGGQRGQ